MVQHGHPGVGRAGILAYALHAQSGHFHTLVTIQRFWLVFPMNFALARRRSRPVSRTPVGP